MSTCQATTRWQYDTEHRGREGLQIDKSTYCFYECDRRLFPLRAKETSCDIWINHYFCSCISNTIWKKCNKSCWEQHGTCL